MNVNRNSKQDRSRVARQRGRGWSVLAVVVGLGIIGLQTGCFEEVDDLEEMFFDTTSPSWNGSSGYISPTIDLPNTVGDHVLPGISAFDYW